MSCQWASRPVASPHLLCKGGQGFDSSDTRLGGTDSAHLAYICTTYHPLAAEWTRYINCIWNPQKRKCHASQLTSIQYGTLVSNSLENSDGIPLQFNMGN